MGVPLVDDAIRAWRMIFWTGWKMAEAIFFCQDTFIRSVFILRIIYKEAVP